MTIIKKVKAPVRIDCAGGTTDIYPFTHTHGGAVLNIAINKYVVGEIIKSSKQVSLKYKGHVPTSSGLGTSGCMNLVWLALISNVIKFNIKEKLELAKQVYNLEQALGGVGGKQDQYAAAFGGINFLEFKKEKVKITPIKLSENLIKELEKRLILVYTGKPHFATSANKSMIDNLKKGKNTSHLIRIRDIAKEMKNTLLKKDLEKFAELLNEETKERKQLAKHILPPGAEKIIKIGKQNGAVAAKICGSGNGGSILFFGDKNKLKKKFKRKIIDFKIDFEGLRKI